MGLEVSVGLQNQHCGWLILWLFDNQCLYSPKTGFQPELPGSVLAEETSYLLQGADAFSKNKEQICRGQVVTNTRLKYIMRLATTQHVKAWKLSSAAK